MLALGAGACSRLPVTAPAAEESAGTSFTAAVPYVPTRPEIVDAMLELGSVGAKDVVYDLGCGDGRKIGRAHV